MTLRQKLVSLLYTKWISCFSGFDWLVGYERTNVMPPKAAAFKGAKQAKATRAGDKKKKKRRRESYAIYIYKVLNQVYPDTGISSKAMSIMNSFINDIFERIAAEPSHLAHYNRHSTITSRKIQTAICLLLLGELVKHAVSDGPKAVAMTTTQKGQFVPTVGEEYQLRLQRMANENQCTTP